MRLKLIFSLIVVILLGLSCKKDPKVNTSGITNSPAENFTPFSFKCDTLPPEPIGLGWIDTTANENHDVKFWAYNPANANEIIYMANDELWAYNINTKSKKYLDKGIGGIPQINLNGWVVYGNVGFNIFIIKTNGDSLKQITSSMGGQEPHWDYTGNYIYYLQNSICVKSNKNGIKVDSINFNSTGAAWAKTSDNYIYSTGTSLFLKNVSNNSSTVLAYDPHGFDHLTFDKADENIYWWDDIGLYKLNLGSSKRDTLVKYCENFTVSALNISPNSDKLTFSYALYKKAGSHYMLLRENDPIQLNLSSNQYQELLIMF